MKTSECCLEKDPTLQDFLKIFDRRRRVILIAAGVVFALAVLACVFTTREYTASSVIELQKMSASSPSLDSLMGGDAAAPATP